jgi:hypothetical protein
MFMGLAKRPLSLQEVKMYLKWFPDLDCDGLGIRPGGPGKNQPTDVGQEKIARCDVFREHSLAGCGMLVAGRFCYGRLLDESSIARESQNSPAPARASDRLLSIWR